MFRTSSSLSSSSSASSSSSCSYFFGDSRPDVVSFGCLSELSFFLFFPLFPFFFALRLPGPAHAAGKGAAATASDGANRGRSIPPRNQKHNIKYSNQQRPILFEKYAHFIILIQHLASTSSKRETINVVLHCTHQA